MKIPEGALFIIKFLGIKESMETNMTTYTQELLRIKIKNSFEKYSAIQKYSHQSTIENHGLWKFWGGHKISPNSGMV